MGGYGALRLGAKYARRFSAISAHSAITRIGEMEDFVDDPLPGYLACAPAAELDPLHWIEAHRDTLSPLRFDCGAEDPLLAGNRRLHQALLDQGLPHEYSEFPGGHDWTYWQRHLPDTLRFVHRACHAEPRR